VVCVWFCIYNHVVFVSWFFPCKFVTYLWHGAFVVRMSLLMCLSSFSICMFIILIPAYVYVNKHMHFPSLPYSYTFIAIFMCIFFCMLSYICTHLFVFFLLFPKDDRHLCCGVYWCNHTPPHILKLRLLLYFHFVFCISTIDRTGTKIIFISNLHV